MKNYLLNRIDDDKSIYVAVSYREIQRIDERLRSDNSDYYVCNISNGFKGEPLDAVNDDNGCRYFRIVKK